MLVLYQKSLMDRAIVIIRWKSTARMVRVRKRTERGSGNASSKTSGPRYDEGYKGRQPSTERDVWVRSSSESALC